LRRPFFSNQVIINAWNALSDHIVTFLSVSCFKRRLDSFYCSRRCCFIVFFYCFTLFKAPANASSLPLCSDVTSILLHVILYYCYKIVHEVQICQYVSCLLCWSVCESQISLISIDSYCHCITFYPCSVTKRNCNVGLMSFQYCGLGSCESISGFEVNKLTTYIA